MTSERIVPSRAASSSSRLGHAVGDVRAQVGPAALRVLLGGAALEVAQALLEPLDRHAELQRDLPRDRRVGPPGGLDARGLGVLHVVDAAHRRVDRVAVVVGRLDSRVPSMSKSKA